MDADQSFLGQHVLTSALKGVDEAVFQTIKGVQDGVRGRPQRGLRAGPNGVGLGTVSSKARQEDIAKVEEIEQQIANGEVGENPD